MAAHALPWFRSHSVDRLSMVLLLVPTPINRRYDEDWRQNAYPRMKSLARLLI